MAFGYLTRYRQNSLFKNINKKMIYKKIYNTFFLIFFLLFTFFSFQTHKNPQRLIWSDMEGYYVYLPSTFIYGGFSQEAVRDKGYIKPWADTGKVFTKYTCGVAILELPFFAAAHMLSGPADFPSDGHSLIYCYGLLASGVFYSLSGLFMLWYYLRRHYKAMTVFLSLLGIFLGTNLFFYTFFQPAMSHVYSFFLSANILWLTDELFVYHEHRTQKKWLYLLLGAVSGLLVLVRPTNAIMLLYPLYRIYQKYREDKGFVYHDRVCFLYAAVMACAIWIPQLIYWKHVTGSWLLWSYQDEGFRYWSAPKLLEVLFGAWNGWILYSPIVILPLIGLYLGKGKNTHAEKAIFVMLLAATYLFASWWAWWFGGAFGHRCYVEYYPFLCAPFALLLTRIRQLRFLNAGVLILFMLLLYYNIGLSYQYKEPWDGPNWTYKSVWNEIEKLF